MIGSFIGGLTACAMLIGRFSLYMAGLRMNGIEIDRNTKGLVLLAAFNGAKFIKPLLESIDNSLDVAVSDDGSTDLTCKVVEGLGREGLYFLPKHASGSASANFSYLFNTVPNHYSRYFFADQDDVWVSEKLTLNLAELSRLEALHGRDTPCLVFSDANVVDENLVTLNPSFLDAEGLDHKFKDSFKLLCCQNVGQGATFAFNRALLDIVRPMPSGVIMHDWWVMLAAAAFGKISFLDRSLILYRQHGSNVLGSRGDGLLLQLNRFLFRKDELKHSLARTQRNAALFLYTYRHILSEEYVEFLEGYSTLSSKSLFYRKYFSIKHGLRKTTLARTLGFYTYI